VFDSVTHTRIYRTGRFSNAAALRLLRAETGTHFDPSVVATFAALLSTGRLYRRSTS
jgi:HD-GYP domain-containing protein (c-di-GMP phosphodiesterase class II)